ncbi:MAG: S41 family peptidase [bacterium]
MKNRDILLFFLFTVLLFAFPAKANATIGTAANAVPKKLSPSPRHTLKHAINISDGALKNIRLFSKVYTLIKKNYVKNEDSKKLIYGAIEGMVATLDPHTYFLTKSEFKEMKEETTGEFVGIGIKISSRNNHIVVISPIDGTPAAMAGIKAGDIIEKINNIPVFKMGIMKAVKLLQGKPGTKVKLLIMRKGFKRPKTFTIERKRILLKSVKYMVMPDHIGYVRISSFQADTNSQLLKDLNILNKKENGLKGLILDLRNNPGGLLNQAVKVCSDFIKKGVIVYTKGRLRFQNVKYYALNQHLQPDYPIAVLVNAGTASAAEITAGSLQVHKRAVIIGVKTFGKGSVQTIYHLPEGAGIGLTTAFYFLPNNVSVQNTGVIPNFIVHSSKDYIFVKPLPKLREIDLRHHFKNPESLKIKKMIKYNELSTYFKKDNQLKFAYELLKSWNILKSH